MEASRVVRVLVSTQSLLQQLVSLCTDACQRGEAGEGTTNVLRSFLTLKLSCHGVNTQRNTCEGFTVSALGLGVKKWKNWYQTFMPTWNGVEFELVVIETG